MKNLEEKAKVWARKGTAETRGEEQYWVQIAAPQRSRGEQDL